MSCVLLLAASPAGVRAAESAKRVTWDEFSGKVNTMTTVRVALPDGAVVEGRVVQAKPDGLDIRVTRTSNPQVHPKGETSISRDALRTVEVRRPRSKGKLIGTLVPLGVGSAIAAGGIYGRQGEDSVYGYAVAGGLIAGVGAPVGFFLGRAVDRRFEQFVILPK